MAFTWMSSGAHEIASDRVSCMTPPLLAAYAAEYGLPKIE
jgi:hypothetical protein